MFIQQKIKPIYEEENIPLSQLRDNELWIPEIEIIYTLNESGMRVLFKKYCTKGCSVLTIKEYENMLLRDAKLGISRYAIREAIAMSKQTIMKETDAKCFVNYNSTQYVEFLEVIARVAITFFRDSELKEKSLNWKLEYVLELIMHATLEMRVNKTPTEVPEFTDSDEDY